MQAVLLGSIGSVVETSELQREAFNIVFARHGLNWHWDLATYRALLGTPGGKTRISTYARQSGDIVDAAAIHADKTEVFADLLRTKSPLPRPGVVESLKAARDLGMKTALVSTTDRRTIDIALKCGTGELEGLFDYVTSADDGFKQKPAADAYQSVAARLGIEPSNAVAIEDNEGGLRAAASANMRVIAFPGANTWDHDVSLADWTARYNVFPVVLGALLADLRDVA